MNRLPEFLRFTLAEIVLIALAAGLGMAALRTGGLFAAAYLLGAVVLSALILVTAIVGRGPLQAFAIGCLVGVSVYGSVLYWYGDQEFDPDRGELLTTRGARPLYDAVREVYYVDVFSGREADAVEAGAAAKQGLATLGYWEGASVGGPIASKLVAKVGSVYWAPEVRPDRQNFMQIIHLLTALTLGYVAGKFGAALHRRRTAPPATAAWEQASPEGESSSPAPGGGTGSLR